MRAAVPRFAASDVLGNFINVDLGRFFRTDYYNINLRRSKGEKMVDILTVSELYELRHLDDQQEARALAVTTLRDRPDADVGRDAVPLGGCSPSTCNRRLRLPRCLADVGRAPRVPARPDQGDGPARLVRGDVRHHFQAPQPDAG